MTSISSSFFSIIRFMADNFAQRLFVLKILNDSLREHSKTLPEFADGFELIYIVFRDLSNFEKHKMILILNECSSLHISPSFVGNLRNNIDMLQRVILPSETQVLLDQELD